MVSRIYALLGPTAAGKSRLAMGLARLRGDVEVVAIDAFTIYRGMDIGTAKPTAEERAEVPHHCIDLREPWEPLTVAEFQAEARAAIDDIQQRGRVPLLVGGSGLYWRAVVDDLRFPPTDGPVRERLEREWGDDPEGAHALLVRLDPEAAAKIEPSNLRRTVRALEVMELTRERFSAFASAWDRYESIYPDLEVGWLDPPRDTLRDAIHERARKMVAEGLLDEAAVLRALPQPLSHTAEQAIGYAEAFAVLEGKLPEEELPDRIASRTWRFAKRQQAWFRSDPRCQPRPPAEILAAWS